ncbi:MAG: esterase-like activity of phytase family protein [Paracoccaceae bacterium]
MKWLFLGTALALSPGIALAEGRAEVVGRYAFAEKIPYFGGFSAVEFSEDGQQFVALSDSAVLFSGSVNRDDAGTILGVMLAGGGAALRDEAGAELQDPWDDSEGLALLPDGDLMISFELRNRVARYTADGQLLQTLPDSIFATVMGNWGLEALAVDTDGALFAMAEGDSQGIDEIPVWRFADGAWSEAFRLPEDHTWRPVGADFGPDGRLYLLERDFWGFIGFMTRIRRISLEADKVTGDEILFRSNAGHYGNAEGLSVWQDAAGQIRLTLVTDNNFTPTLVQEFIDLRVSD